MNEEGGLVEVGSSPHVGESKQVMQSNKTKLLGYQKTVLDKKNI